jgi:hypothetical protein
MNLFSLPRFIRLLQNDVLRIARTVLPATAGMLGPIVVAYVKSFPRAKPTDDPTHIVLFGVCLIGAGLLLTGVAFRDMHHPLQRNHYLMLPCSNFERLLSRYLLTGPLLVLYGSLAFMALDFIGNQITGMWIHEKQLAFSPFTTESLAVIKGYLMAHVVVFIGAICFRTHALIKTILFLTGMFFAMLLLENALERAIFPELFSWTQFDRIRQPAYDNLGYFTATWLNIAIVISFFAWLLVIAYLCLRDHEATDGV